MADRLAIPAGQPPWEPSDNVSDHNVGAEHGDVYDHNDQDEHNVAADQAANMDQTDRQSSESKHL